MNIFDFYSDKSKHGDLAAMFSYAAQQHPQGLAANFIEKDVWVTEILRILYDENLLDGCSVAFKGGTALSKCWGAIDRFSEDIDLSIHWSDLLGVSEDEVEAAWKKSIQSTSQNSTFRKQQQQRLIAWTTNLVERLNNRLSVYNIDGLHAVLETDSNGEKIDVHFPRLTEGENDYQLDHVLLEFGGRNRGKPTEEMAISCYMGEVAGFEDLSLPNACVNVYHPDYILWEKLTALHQFSTQEKDPNPVRLSRHWYDVDCILRMQFTCPFSSQQAMCDVIEMKSHRWGVKGVDYPAILDGELNLLPCTERIAAIETDHNEAINGGMFFKAPDDFNEITTRLKAMQDKINAHNQK